MKTLKRLAVAIALTLVLALAAFADCPPPGEVSAPPCPGAQTTRDDPVVLAETNESSSSGSAVVAEISETTIDVLLSALSIF